jgi:polyisoprenoid-binding protein YceI
MRIAFLTALVITLAFQAQAQSYEPVDANSSVKFAIKNFGVTTNGSFKGLKGTIVFDAAKPGNSSIDVSIDANTVNTGIDSRDNHLRKEDYFNVKDYPAISIKSDKITANGKDFIMSAKLTMKGTVKDISIPFTATAKDNGYLFEGAFQLNRKDFKVGGNSMVLGDDATITLSVFASKK